MSDIRQIEIWAVGGWRVDPEIANNPAFIQTPRCWMIGASWPAYYPWVRHHVSVQLHLGWPPVRLRWVFRRKPKGDPVLKVRDVPAIQWREYAERYASDWNRRLRG